jgi:PAS domain S-box-containing protein
LPVKLSKESENRSEILQLKRAFDLFEQNSKRLESAYAKMQDDFRKLNIELDAKNEELQQRLQENRTVREQLNSILQSLQNGVIVVDTNGTIIHCNRAAEMAGLSAQEILGKRYKQVISLGKEPRGLLYTLESGKEIKNEEREITTKEKTKIPVNYSTSLVKDNQGKNLGALEVFQDISDLKAMEQEVQHARTLAALGEMSAAVAHEIRNPLGGIGTYAALLERDLERNDPRRKLVINIMQGIATLNKIVTNLLVYTRPMHGDFQRVHLQEVIGEIADFALLEIEQQYKVQINLNKKFPSKKLFSRIDPEKLQQLLLNLLFNAAQAMPQGGTITVGLRQTAKTPEGVRTIKFKSWNCVSIRDTGVGIPEEKMAKIFNPFYTTREDGTGLGLAIVKKIAEFHKGTIQVQNAPQGGALFELSLPMVE